MCEYCGCQALASIDALTREHEQVLGLISDVRAARLAGDVVRQADLACRIAAVLGPHTLIEERGLFPALARDFPGQIALLEAEHRLVEATLAEAVRAAGDGGLPADPGWPDRLTRALAVLREHIFKEQDGVFPAALATLSTADWEAADAVRIHAGAT
jgi:hemerythrin-like domain-containing protein